MQNYQTKICNICKKQFLHNNQQNRKQYCSKECSIKGLRRYRLAIDNRVHSRSNFGISNRRAYSMKKLYNLDIEVYEQILLLQNMKCAICESNWHVGERKKWHIDHCHKTKKVRGILCTNCNHLLGCCDDNIHILENAIHYLNMQEIKSDQVIK